MSHATGSATSRVKTVKTPTQPGLLVVVHPGSACGSASFNLGWKDAVFARTRLIRDISTWRGHVLVVDGYLSDELEDRPQLQRAIRTSLSRACRDGHRHGRMKACDASDEQWPETIAKTVVGWKLPHGTVIGVTGAWYFDDGSGGCVNATIDVLQALKIGPVEVLDGALRDPAGTRPSEAPLDEPT